MAHTVKADEVATGLGLEVRRRREALGLSREQLAVRAGVSFETLGAVERGDNDARTSTVLAIATALETTPDALLGLEK
jgi:transcriptional regulator with XRE-family HTH domain